MLHHDPREVSRNNHRLNATEVMHPPDFSASRKLLVGTMWEDFDEDSGLER